MKFHFIYVEDNPNYKMRVQRAVDRHESEGEPVSIRMTHAKDPDQLADLLKRNQDVDLVLADVYFRMGKQEFPRLKEIIAIVGAAAANTPTRPTVPIIAYTGYGEDALSYCLKHKDELFDIWDKESASPSYVTWRLSKIAIELSRMRPDTCLQRLIQDMPCGASWHNYVTEMPYSYNLGESEFSQIDNIGTKVKSIASALQIYEPVKDMWSVMTKWEHISRAVSRKDRGHARHVINVFWMGYYILHHKLLREWFERTWEDRLRLRGEDFLRSNSHGVAPLGSSEERSELPQPNIEIGGSLSEAWFMAGLFHDVAGCVPKYPLLKKAGDDLIGMFNCLTEPLTKWIPDEFNDEADGLFHDLDADVASVMIPLWKKSLVEQKPDHGVVAALFLRRRFRDSRQTVIASEAAQAVAVHNLIGEIGVGVSNLLSWTRDPLTCLLILCDQIQTWDRERGDEGIYGPDLPWKAHLTELEVSEGKKPKIAMTIDYILPRHLEHSRDLYERVKGQLEEVLNEKPRRALARLAPDWPFDLEVKCLLSGQSLGDLIVLGS